MRWPEPWVTSRSAVDGFVRPTFWKVFFRIVARLPLMFSIGLAKALLPSSTHPSMRSSLPEMSMPSADEVANVILAPLVQRKVTLLCVIETVELWVWFPATHTVALAASFPCIWLEPAVRVAVQSLPPPPSFQACAPGAPAQTQV